MAERSSRTVIRGLVVAVLVCGLLYPARPTHGESSAVLLHRGKASYEQQKYDEAADYLKRALDASPGGIEKVDILFWLGITAYQKKEYDQAVRYLNRAVEPLNRAAKTHPTWSKIYRWLGVAYRKIGDDRNALSAYRTAARLDPAYWGNHADIGLTHVDLGEYRAAIEPLLEALRLHPAPDELEYTTEAKGYLVYRALGDAYMGLGDLENAAKFYSKEFGTAELSAGMFHASATSRQEEDKELALKFYGKAALVAPLDQPHRHLYLARFLIKLGRKDEAIEHLETSAALAPASSSPDFEISVFEDLARVYFDRGEYAKAIRAYETLVALKHPKVPLPRSALGNLGISYAVLGNYVKAVEVLTRGLNAYPDSDVYFEWLVMASYGAGGWSAAESVWHRARPGGPSGDLKEVQQRKLKDLIHRGAWGLGELAEKSRIFYAALTHYSLAFTAVHALDMYIAGVENDALREIRRRLARIYRHLPLKPLPPQLAVRHAMEAERSLAKRDWSGTVQGYRHAVEIAPWWPEAYYNLGLAFAVSPGALPGAMREMKVYLEFEPNGRHATKAREKLRLWQAQVDQLVRDHEQTISDGPFLIGPDREPR